MKKNRYLILGFIFGLILVGVAFALTSNNKPTSTSQITPSPTLIEPSNITPSVTPPATSIFSQKLIYWVKAGEVNNIYAYDGTKKQHLFTDSNEKQKILSFSNISAANPILLALTSSSRTDSIGNLYQISMDGKGTMTLIANDFATNEPPLPIISPNSLKIAYVIFSNAEADYGYSLYTMSLDGTNKRKIAGETESITSLAWSPDSQAIVYVKESQDNKTEIKRVNLTSQNTIIKLYGSTQPIVNMTWPNSDMVEFSVKVQSEDFSIYSLKPDKGAKPQLLATHLPAAEFLWSKAEAILYLSGNNLFKYSTADKKSAPINLENVHQILGWLP